LYLKFYTVFLTINVVALGVTVQYIQGFNRVPIVGVFAMQNAVCILTAIKIAGFSRSTSDRIRTLCEDIAGVKSSGDDASSAQMRHVTDSPAPGEFGYWAGVVIALGHATMVVTWICLMAI
jgi:hypothetical protein